jgi:phosphatidylglycerophosphate synthase
MIETAIVVCPRGELPEAAMLGLRVAGLQLLTRALLTAQHAGIERLLVVASPAQQCELRRHVAIERRLGGRVHWVDGVSEIMPPAGRSVVMIPSVILQADALRAWGVRADTADGVAVPAGVDVGPWAVPSPLVVACVAAAGEGLAGLERFHHVLRSQGHVRAVPWEGATPEVVRSARDVPGVEHRMLRTQRSSEDGPIVDRFINRTVSEGITRLAVRGPITPNQVTVVSLLTGLLGAWLLAHASFAASVSGLLFCQLSVVLDHVDGEIARLKFQFSRLGKWLDNFSDHVVDLAVIACVAWRLAVVGEAWSVAPLGIAAAAGVTGSFAVVFWWSLAERHVSGNEKARRGVETLTSMANRDGFYLALWATLLVGRPAWFLWTLAIGSNAYWVVWLALCGLPARTGAHQMSTAAHGPGPRRVSPGSGEAEAESQKPD